MFDANLHVRASAADRTTFADVTVVCGAPTIDPADRTRQTVLNPSVLIEVLSPSTASDDRGPKLDCYKTIGSVRAVVLVAQDEPSVVIHELRADGTWSQASYADGAVPLPAIGCSLSLTEIYEDLPDA